MFQTLSCIHPNDNTLFERYLEIFKSFLKNYVKFTIDLFLTKSSCFLILL